MGDINEQKEVYTNQRERGQARIWGAGQSNKMVILKGSQSIFGVSPICFLSWPEKNFRVWLILEPLRYRNKVHPDGGKDRKAKESRLFFRYLCNRLICRSVMRPYKNVLFFFF